MDDLRARLLADLGNERPPPIGDVVAVALRDGRRWRRKRRIGAFAACAVLAGAVTGATVIVRDDTVAPGPSRLPVAAASAVPGGTGAGRVTVTMSGKPPTEASRLDTVTVRSGFHVAFKPMKATPAAMLRLLTVLLPSVKMTQFAVSADDDLTVRLLLDGGAGPAMLRVALGRTDAPAPRGDTAQVTVTQPDGCRNGYHVFAAWPDGTQVTVDLDGCPPGFPARPAPPPPALSLQEVERVAADPQWGITMDADLVVSGAQQFSAVGMFKQ